jgi:hypothetical protein
MAVDPILPLVLQKNRGNGIFAFDFELLIIDQNLSYPDMADYILDFDPDIF